MVTERDPGERHLYDHLVGYLQWQHSKGRLVLGDLRAGFSQGLVFGRGSGRGRGRPRRDSHTLGLRSSAENRAIRGAAASLGRGQWLVVVLVGQLRRDARFDEAGNVRSLPEDGLHTGPTALAGEVALSGQVAGLRLRWQREDRHVGLVLQHLRFGQRLRLSSRYGRPVFVGRSQASGAIDGGWIAGRRQFYGHLARTPSSWSFVGGFVDRRRNRLRWSGQVRSYGPRFFSPLGSADRRWKTWNERGVVIDLRGSRWRTWAEIAQRPKPASIPVSDDSAEAGFERTWRVSPGQLRLDLRQRYDLDWWQHARYRGTQRIRLAGTRSSGLHRWRIQWHNSLSDGERGMALGLEGWRKGPAGQTNLQFTLFRIPSWSSRIYEYESTLPGAVSIRPLSGTGWRLNAALGHRSGPWMLAAFGRHERRQHLPARSVFGVQIDHLGADTKVR